MTLFDKSLKLAMFASVALLVACPPTDKEDTADEADADTDTDADTDVDIDTGASVLAYVGSITTTDGAFTSGTLGYGAYGIAAQDYVCTNIGTITEEPKEVVPEGCPDCEWAFNLSPITGSTATGTYCEAMLDAPGMVSGALDDALDYSWGFAPTYSYTAEDDTLVTFEPALFLFDETDSVWFPFMINYPPNDIYHISGDGTALSFGRIASIDAAGTPLYYFYYL